MKAIPVFAVLLVMVQLASSGTKCRCVHGNSHPQDKFCTSDYGKGGFLVSLYRQIRVIFFLWCNQADVVIMFLHVRDRPSLKER